jgi:hypothetical protein
MQTPEIRAHLSSPPSAPVLKGHISQEYCHVQQTGAALDGPSARPSVASSAWPLLGQLSRCEAAKCALLPLLIWPQRGKMGGPRGPSVNSLPPALRLQGLMTFAQCMTLEHELSDPCLSFLPCTWESNASGGWGGSYLLHTLALQGSQLPGYPD